MSRKCRTVLGLLVLLMFVATPNAQAHAQLVNASPSVDSHLSSLPNKVQLEFDDNLQIFEGKTVNVLLVEDSNGKQIDAGDSIVAGAGLSVNIRDRSGSGKFHVSYRVVSDDGHSVSGDYYFTVTGTGASLATASPSRSAASPTASVKVPSDVAEDSSPKDSLWTRQQDHILLGFFAFIAILIWWKVDKRG